MKVYFKAIFIGIIIALWGFVLLCMVGDSFYIVISCILLGTIISCTYLILKKIES